MKFDHTDRKILSILQEDGRITTKDLAQKIHLSNTPVYERVKKLEKGGVIKKYAAILDKEKIGRNLIIFLMVSLKEHSKHRVEEYKKEVMSMKEVMEFYYISGNYDSLLKIMVADMEEFKTFIEDKLSRVPLVTQFQSIFVISGEEKNAFEL